MIKIAVKNRQNRIHISPVRVKKIVRHIFKQERIADEGEITVSVVTDNEIRGLNKRYLGKDYPTDVLAFNLGGGGKIRADIIISAETACVYSGVFHTSPLYEIYLYIIHGLLHILGYDDTTPRKRKMMHKRELFLLSDVSHQPKADS